MVTSRNSAATIAAPVSTILSGSQRAKWNSTPTSASSTYSA